MTDHFQQLYEQSDDPWQVRQRWYEQRKRAVLLASLPASHMRHVFEPACGNGELTAALARQADRVTATDLSPAAVQLTRDRLAGAAPGRVSVECQRIPQQWPQDSLFDLIVISEMAYYLNTAELDQLRQRCIDTLAMDGALLLCHWRHPFADRQLSTEAIHGAFDDCPDLHRIARHDESDFLLDVWSRSPRSVAQREGVSP
ncbi:methyltransferase domain-containing protein [Pseudoduganella sp. FT26W]|uniref:Methyltransferase domain-containing protein n=1 Tax=Duganella aquatilis TaxID=2666082 RepID=A0A844D5G6_9BURK|nr:class I SAM-dependent methyltransferase [Duganella aquatilis]MRW82750.1 methyltransferase domain-containing protein [Duganella aquatilis]